MELKCNYLSVILIELLPLKIITKTSVRTSSTSDNVFAVAEMYVINYVAGMLVASLIAGFSSPG